MPTSGTVTLPPSKGGLVISAPVRSSRMPPWVSGLQQTGMGTITLAREASVPVPARGAGELRRRDDPAAQVAHPVEGFSLAEQPVVAAGSGNQPRGERRKSGHL